MIADEDLAELDATALRKLFISNVLLEHEQKDLKSRIDLFPDRFEIETHLIIIGGDTERELLPLLDNDAPAVRLSAACAIGRFNPALCYETLRRLAASEGDIAEEARTVLELRSRQRQAAAEPEIEGIDDSASTGGEAVPRPWSADQHRPADRAGRELNWQHSNPPSSAMSGPELGDRLFAAFSGVRARQILALARPAVCLWPQRLDEPLGPLCTYLDGHAWAPPDWKWPLCDGEPLHFLGQIYLPELAALPGAEVLPREGVLAFFGDFAFLDGGCGAYADPAQRAVYHWPAEGLVPVQTPVPRNLDPDEYRQTPVVLRPSISLPHPCSRTVKWLRLGKVERERYEEVYDAAEYRGIPASERSWCDTESRILGWPKLVQQDVDLRQTGTGAFRLLVQLPARFGPGGSLYFFIPKTTWREPSLTAASWSNKTPDQSAARLFAIRPPAAPPGGVSPVSASGRRSAAAPPRSGGGSGP